MPTVYIPALCIAFILNVTIAFVSVSGGFNGTNLYGQWLNGLYSSAPLSFAIHDFFH